VKGTKRFRYYVTRDPSPDQPAWRVSAHDVERIVRTRIEALLLDRDRIARLVVAVDPQQVSQVISVSTRLAESGSLLLDPATIGIDRINLCEDRIDIMITETGLLRACEIIAPHAPPATITLSAPGDRQHLTYKSGVDKAAESGGYFRASRKLPFYLSFMDCLVRDAVRGGRVSIPI